MANNHVIRTARLTNRQVLDLMFALNDGLNIISAYVNIGLNKTIRLEPFARDSEPMKSLDRDRYGILDAYAATTTGINIFFLRGTCPDTEHIHQNRTASPYYDEIAVTGQVNEDIDEFFKCMDIIQDSLPKIYSLEQESPKQSPVDVLQAEMASLTNEYKKLLGGLESQRIQFQESYEAERQKLNEDHQAAMMRLENEDLKRKNEFSDYVANQKGELQREKEELDERAKGFDDRQYMHTRRDLRNQITKNYKDRMGQAVVSSRAWWIQWLIFLAILFAGSVAGYFSIESYHDLLNSENATNDQWKMIGLSVRSFTLTVVAVGFFFYAINWLKGIYVDHVQTERKYENFGNDIDRASFVIETIMEVGEREHAEVPDTWISGVCRNLFTEKGSDSYDSAPSSVATVLLESISGAKFRTDGTKIEIDKRGARKLAKKSKKTD